MDRLAHFPGVGRKSALRMALFVLRSPREYADELIEAIRAVKDKISFCGICGTMSEQNPCPVCADTQRDHSRICVVEETRDMLALERSGAWRGVYHILGGALAPLDGVGPDQLRLGDLSNRVRSGGVAEVVVATNPTADGEATALYIARMLASTGVQVTRIARGVPVGGDIELVDDSTLQQSLNGRRELRLN